jgi:hypothetical protein
MIVISTKRRIMNNFYTKLSTGKLYYLKIKNFSRLQKKTAITLYFNLINQETNKLVDKKSN